MHPPRTTVFRRPSKAASEGCSARRVSVPAPSRESSTSVNADGRGSRVGSIWHVCGTRIFDVGSSKGSGNRWCGSRFHPLTPLPKLGDRPWKAVSATASKPISEGAHSRRWRIVLRDGCLIGILAIGKRAAAPESRRTCHRSSNLSATPARPRPGGRTPWGTPHPHSRARMQCE